MSEIAPTVEPIASRRAARLSATQVALVLSIIALIVSVATLATLLRISRRNETELGAVRKDLRSGLDEAAWSGAADRDTASNSTIQPEVGTIQFLKNNFSIQLEQVEYTPTGLVLQGYVGNPTNLNLESLSLRITARRPFYTAKDKFLQAKSDSIDRFFVSGDEIGSGQSAPIAWLHAGTRAKFAVTVPNVHQNKEGIELLVAFTGERYSYLY